jgi:hypothetical protein
MKVRFYCDIWPGAYPRNPLFANTQPNYEKAANSKRLAFDVVIPDNLLNDVDAVSPEPAAVTLVADAE